MAAIKLIWDVGSTQSKRYPTVARTFRHFRKNIDTRTNSVRYSSTVLLTRWQRFYDELSELLQDELRIPDDSALQSIMASQCAVMPAVGRFFPQTIELKHDVVGYLRDLRVCRATGTPPKPLHLYPPGELTVTDPLRMCRRPLELLIPYSTHRVHFELQSDLQTDTTRHRFIFMSDVDGWNWWTRIPKEALQVARVFLTSQWGRVDRWRDAERGVARSVRRRTTFVSDAQLAEVK
jgi:hypothetical protein